MLARGPGRGLVVPPPSEGSSPACGPWAFVALGPLKGGGDLKTRQLPLLTTAPRPGGRTRAALLSPILPLPLTFFSGAARRGVAAVVR